jgi:hypothetical protein
MTPIEKNIRVVDDSNNEYEPTYPKRAKGLVKNGRARFVNSTTICLIHPPIYKTEEIIMTENTEPVVIPKAESIGTNSKYTIDYLLGQIEKIASQTDHLTRALDALVAMDDGITPEPYSPGNVVGQAKAEAIGQLVSSREATNQQIIRLYEKMYDDLKPVTAEKPKTDHDPATLSIILDAVSRLPPDVATKIITERINKYL